MHYKVFGFFFTEELHVKMVYVFLYSAYAVCMIRSLIGFVDFLKVKICIAFFVLKPFAY